MLANLQVLKEDHQVMKGKKRNSNQSILNDVAVIHREVSSWGNRDLEKYVNDKCSKALLKNDEYGVVSNKSIELFNSLKSLLGNNAQLLFEYEETMAKMQEIVEIEAYKLDRETI